MKKLILLSLLFTFTVKIQAQIDFKSYFIAKTLRLDYIHSGNCANSFISFVQLKKEPYWGGRQKQLIDNTGYGHFRIVVKDSLTGKIIYSQGYNTLFQEWQTTNEAKQMQKAMYETVVMPFPKNTIQIQLVEKNKKLEEHEAFSQYVNPKNYFINEDSLPKFPVKKIVDNGSPADNVDIVFLAEGYTKSEMQKFQADAKRFADYLFKTKPYSENKNKFNFYTIESISQESGTDIPGQHLWKNTCFNSNFYTFGTDRYLTTEDMKNVHDIAAEAPYDQIIMLVNTDKYGGGGMYNFYSIFTASNIYSDLVFVHEFGHAFAGLADEYFDSSTSYNDFYDLSVEPYEPNITTLKNFDKKWKNFLPKDVPIPTSSTDASKYQIGVYEGGGYSAKGIYRPSYDCSMRVLKIDGFCPVCRSAIQMMIDFCTK